jgi:hypothetical protein
MREIEMIPGAPPKVISLRMFPPEERARIDQIILCGDGRLIIRFEEPKNEVE